MDWESLLKPHYQHNQIDDIEDYELLDEAIATLESYFETMDQNQLCTMSRPLGIAYLALINEKKQKAAK